MICSLPGSSFPYRTVYALSRRAETQIGSQLGKDSFTQKPGSKWAKVLGVHSKASERPNYQSVSPSPHTRQLLSSPEDLQHSTPQTWPAGLESRYSVPSPAPLYLLQPSPLPGPVDCSTSWHRIAPVYCSQEEKCHYPKNLLNVCKGDLGRGRRGDWVAARAENKLLYMTVRFWIAEEINAFACCSCITVPSHTEMKCCHVQQPALHCSSGESPGSNCSPEPQTTEQNV